MNGWYGARGPEAYNGRLGTGLAGRTSSASIRFGRNFIGPPSASVLEAHGVEENLPSGVRIRPMTAVPVPRVGPRPLVGKDLLLWGPTILTQFTFHPTLIFHYLLTEWRFSANTLIISNNFVFSFLKVKVWNENPIWIERRVPNIYSVSNMTFLFQWKNRNYI